MSSEYINQLWEGANAAWPDNPTMAEVAFTQAVHEGGPKGSSLAKKYNNYHGIKAVGGQAAVPMGTWEQRPDGSKYKTTANFAVYDSVEGSFVAHRQLLENNSRYKNVLLASNPDEAFSELRKAGYATDKLYPQKLTKVRNTYLPKVSQGVGKSVEKKAQGFNPGALFNPGVALSEGLKAGFNKLNELSAPKQKPSDRPEVDTRLKKPIAHTTDGDIDLSAIGISGTPGPQKFPESNFQSILPGLAESYQRGTSARTPISGFENFARGLLEAGSLGHVSADPDLARPSGIGGNLFGALGAAGIGGFVGGVPGAAVGGGLALGGLETQRQIDEFGHIVDPVAPWKVGGLNIGIGLISPAQGLAKNFLMGAGFNAAENIHNQMIRPTEHPFSLGELAASAVLGGGVQSGLGYLAGSQADNVIGKTLNDPNLRTEAGTIDNLAGDAGGQLFHGLNQKGDNVNLQPSNFAPLQMTKSPVFDTSAPVKPSTIGETVNLTETPRPIKSTSDPFVGVENVAAGDKVDFAPPSRPVKEVTADPLVKPQAIPGDKIDISGRSERIGPTTRPDPNINKPNPGDTVNLRPLETNESLALRTDAPHVGTISEGVRPNAISGNQVDLLPPKAKVVAKQGDTIIAEVPPSRANKTAREIKDMRLLDDDEVVILQHNSGQKKVQIVIREKPVSPEVHNIRQRHRAEVEAIQRQGLTPTELSSEIARLAKEGRKEIKTLQSTKPSVVSRKNLSRGSDLSRVEPVTTSVEAPKRTKVDPSTSETIKTPDEHPSGLKLDEPKKVIESEGLKFESKASDQPRIKADGTTDKRFGRKHRQGHTPDDNIGTSPEFNMEPQSVRVGNETRTIDVADNSRQLRDAFDHNNRIASGELEGEGIRLEVEMLDKDGNLVTRSMTPTSMGQGKHGLTVTGRVDTSRGVMSTNVRASNDYPSVISVKKSTKPAHDLKSPIRKDHGKLGKALQTVKDKIASNPKLSKQAARLDNMMIRGDYDSAIKEINRMQKAGTLDEYSKTLEKAGFGGCRGTKTS